MFEAIKVALDLTPRQERLFASHAGAARFAYNAGLAHVKDMFENSELPDWSHYALRRWWNANKDTNAAINIKVAGSAPEIQNARGGDVRRTGIMSGNADPNETRIKQPPKGGMRLGADFG